MEQVNFIIKSLLGLVVVLLLTGAWVQPAAAQTEERDGSRLEYGLKLALLRLDALQDRLDNARAGADLVEEFIQDEQAKGRDTSALETALAELRAKIDEAQALHDEAGQILDEKAGFDENGKVVDRGQARDTLEEAHRAMQDASQTLLTARQDFRQALRDYRQSNRNRK
jgi:hypothetical protein